MPNTTLPTTSRIDPRFLDVKPVRGSLSIADSERLMKKYGLHPMTDADRKKFRPARRD